MNTPSCQCQAEITISSHLGKTSQSWPMSRCRRPRHTSSPRASGKSDQRIVRYRVWQTRFCLQPQTVILRVTKQTSDTQHSLKFRQNSISGVRCMAAWQMARGRSFVPPTKSSSEKAKQRGERATERWNLLSLWLTLGCSCQICPHMKEMDYLL